MQQRIALATWAGLPELFEDDRLLLVELRRRGILAAPAVWDDPEVDWGSFEAVVLRSTWDYHRRPVEFLDWAARCAQKTQLWNPIDIVRWNSHKRYLAELAQRGLPIIPTEVGRHGESLAQLSERTGWSKVVVKPAISANAEGSHLVDREGFAAFEPRYRDLLGLGEQLVQPFVASVLTSGERSLVYFGGRFSHAFRKGPALPVDLRKETGNPAVDPTASERALADRAISSLPWTPLYARVDLVEGSDSHPVLMELELIEPWLGFAIAPDLASRFVDELLSRVGGR